MTQQRRGRIDGLADRSAGSSPVSPIEETAPFAGSSQDQANERAIPEGNLRLSAQLDALLRALPDPGDDRHYRPAVRAADLVAEGLPGYPELDELAAIGLAYSNRGWWRKTKAGVLHLRTSPSPQPPTVGGTDEA